MKRQFLLTRMLLLFALIVGSGNLWADETPAYSLTFTRLSSGTNYSSYTGAHDIEVSDIGWSVYGNQSVGNYIRVGGKTITNTDRTLTSSASLVNKKIYKVIINHNGVTNGSNTTITVNSIKVEGSTSSDYPPASTISKTITSPSVSSSGSLTFEPDEVWAENSYFRITVNYKVTTTKTANNCGINITSVNFYEQVAPEITASDVDIDADILAGNISYSISHPDGSTLTAAKKSGDWLTVGAVDTENKKVAFTATENTGVEREAVVTLTYGSVTKDVTITQAAAATKYAVTFSAPSNGTLVVKRGDDAISSGDEVPEGTTLTIVATPADGYNFNKWEYSTNGGSTWNDGVGTTYEVTSTVQFRASFVAKVYYTITYSVNGVETKTKVEEGEAISFAAPASGIPSGYTFRGWVVEANKIDTPTDTDPKANYVTSATSTADITYYAVMASGSVTPTTATLTANSSWSGYAEKTFTDDEGNKWSAYCSGQNSSGTYNYGLNKNANNYNIGSPAFSGNVTAISMKVANSSSNDARTVYICSSNSTAQPTSGDIASLSVPKSSTYDTNRSVDLSSSPTFNRFYVYVSAFLSFSEIKVTYNKTAYSKYCTTVPTTSVSVGAKGYATYCNSVNALDFTDKSIKAYTINSTDGSALTLTQKNKVAKGEPVLLYSSTNNDSQAITVIADAAATADASNKLKAGTGAAVTWVENGNQYYILYTGGAKPGFYRANNSTIAVGKAYLDLTGLPATAREFFSFFDDETTGINAVDVENANAEVKNNVYYNLNGQRVANPSKGLYIVNGKKVIMK